MDTLSTMLAQQKNHPGLGDPYEDPYIPQRPVTFPNLSNFGIDLEGRQVDQKSRVKDVPSNICLPALQTLH